MTQAHELVSGRFELQNQPGWTSLPILKITRGPEPTLQTAKERETSARQEVVEVTARPAEARTVQQHTGG